MMGKIRKSFVKKIIFFLLTLGRIVIWYGIMSSGGTREDIAVLCGLKKEVVQTYLSVAEIIWMAGGTSIRIEKRIVFVVPSSGGAV